MMCRSEEHTSELQSLMRNSYAGFCLKKKKQHTKLPLNKTTSTHNDTTASIASPRLTSHQLTIMLQISLFALLYNKLPTKYIITPHKSSTEISKKTISTTTILS